MVVSYHSGAEGSCCSFLTVTPRLLFRYKGSVIPNLLPQIILAVGVSLVAAFVPEARDLFQETNDAFNVIGILLSFLVVFKTQVAYQQFWQGTEHVDNLLKLSRAVAMSVATVFTPCEDLDTDREELRVVRLLALHYFVVIEYFQRTGYNETVNADVQDQLRDDIRSLSGSTEFKALYPEDGDELEITGSASRCKYANPTLVLLWIHVAIGRVYKAGGLAPPIVANLHRLLEGIMEQFWNMNKIDKTQFPLPYAQIVKLLLVTYVYSLPFRLIASAGTVVVTSCTVIATIGFFGMDEVAEVLESPFGNDPNDIELRRYGRRLLLDLAMIHRNRNATLDSVLGKEEEFDLEERAKSYEYKRSKSSILRGPTFAEDARPKAKAKVAWARSSSERIRQS